VVGVVGVAVAAMVVVYIYPLFSGPAAPYLFVHMHRYEQYHATTGIVYVYRPHTAAQRLHAYVPTLSLPGTMVPPSHRCSTVTRVLGTMVRTYVRTHVHVYSYRYHQRGLANAHVSVVPHGSYHWYRVGHTWYSL
jgi:hypothetical protein